MAEAAATEAAPAVRIAPPESREEHEADRLADRVLSGDLAQPPDLPHHAPGTIYRQCASCSGGGKPCAACAQEEDAALLFRKEAPGGQGATSSAASTAAKAVQTGGMPLSPDTRAYFEPRFGADLGHVRLHADRRSGEAARAINAQAYALGNHIAFAPGAYQPESDAGRRLIGHELAHVVGGSATGDPGAIHRQLLPGGIADSGLPAGVPTAETAPESGGAGDAQTDEADGTDDRDVTMVHDRVDRIIVSCEQRRIAFVTAGATYLYHLTHCNRNLPAMTYIATVSRDRARNRIFFSLRPQDEAGATAAPEEAPSAETGGAAPAAAEDARPNAHGEDASFGWRVRRGQIDPVDLFHEQDSVLVDYGGTAPVPSTERRRRECLMTMNPRRVFAGRSETQRLIDREFSVEWDLVEFGLGDLDVTVTAGVQADVQFGHGDGMLRDICLSSGEGDGQYEGRARFETRANASLALNVFGAVDFGLEALGLFHVLTAGGELDIDAGADLAGQISTPVEISYDRNASDSPFGLITDMELAGLVRLGMNLSATAGINVMGIDIFRTDWPEIYSAQRDWGWTGGLRFDNSFIPEPHIGSLNQVTAAQLNVAPLSGPGGRRRRRARGARSGLPIGDLIRAALGIGEGEMRYDGSSCDKALPLTWIKPTNLYPERLNFDPAVNPGVSPESVGREDRPTLVSHDPVTPRWPPNADPITGPTPIGVDPENWVETGSWARCFEYDSTAVARRRESGIFRRLMRGLGYNLGGLQIDHVRELQFGGEDEFHNLWPYDSRANQSGGTLNQSQLNAYRGIFGLLHGKYFRITSVGLDPDFERPPLPAPGDDTALPPASTEPGQLEPSGGGDLPALPDATDAPDPAE